jgi:hypothetical protein
MGNVAALAAALLYLTNATIIAQAFDGFYLLQLAPLPFFFALRAFSKMRFGSFTFWIIIALCLREDVAIALAGFALVTLAARRDFRWLISGLCLPIAWWLLCTAYVEPTFREAAVGPFGGRGSLGLYSDVMEHLVLMDSTWMHNVVLYLYRLLRAGGYLCLLGVEGLLTVPILVANGLLGSTFEQGTDAISRFGVLPSCALIGGSVAIVARMCKAYNWNPARAGVIAFLLLPCVCLLDGAKDAIQSRIASLTKTHNANALREAITLIPAHASVAGFKDVLPALSNREKLFYAQFLEEYPDPEIDYFLLDLDEDRILANQKMRLQYSRTLMRMKDSKKYELVWQEGDYCLYRRNHS